jgi:hypothetical protein
MHTFKDISILRLSACTAIFLGLLACDRDSYTTWNCSSTSQTKISMVLRKAQMEFQGNIFKFCGSLGNQSYFDQQCSAQTEQSSVVFIPSSGSLVVGGQEYQCKAL